LETITKTGVFDAPDFLTGFIGVQQLTGIGRIELLSRSNTPNSVNFNFTIDDLRFESVPEPSGLLLLLGLGLVGCHYFPRARIELPLLARSRRSENSLPRSA
jgi:hypothetical protein